MAHNWRRREDRVPKPGDDEGLERQEEPAADESPVVLRNSISTRVIILLLLAMALALVFGPTLMQQRQPDPPAQQDKTVSTPR